MFKGLFYLFITGILFNPAVFFGALTGIVAYLKLDGEKLQILCFNYHIYLLFFVLMFLYIYLFRKSYNEEYTRIDWKATFWNIIKHFIIMTFSFFMGILAASYFDFSLPESKSKNTDLSEYSEVMQLQKQVEDWENNYNKMLSNIK